MRMRQMSKILFCLPILGLLGCPKPVPPTQTPTATQPPNTSVTYVTPLGYTIAAAEPGQVLQWRLYPTSANISYFFVSFSGVDPCGDHPPLLGWKDHPASCTVKTTSSSPVLYNYSLQVVTKDSKIREIPFRVIPCNNCGSVIGPIDPGTPLTHGNTNPPAGGTQPSTPPDFPGKPNKTLPAHSAADIPGFIEISCKNDSLQLNSPNTQAGLVLWQADSTVSNAWTVTFSSTPCGDDKAFSVDNNTCTVASGLTPGTAYKYVVHVPTGCKNNVTGTITIP